VEETERLAIEEALQQCGHSQSQAAERLGLTRSELEAKIREYNIPADNAAAEQEGTPV
jgi:DNA-binding NtrC family response regulator